MTEPISNQTNISLENVIAALEACSFIDDPDCSKCYLDGPGFGFACRDQLRRFAIDLLKLREPKPPVVKENSYGWKFYYCPSCGKEFYQNNKFSFCEKCGQAVKWE